MLCCRYGFLDNLTLGGPTPLGARKANLTEMTRPFMEEVALNEQVGSACAHQLHVHAFAFKISRTPLHGNTA